ncbi:glycosidase [Silvibacterium bohemicum]|uniref:Glycosidase n=1 Tax=Silvibacterium bohemicum TaxID=1577686 RepID=A0A841JVD7_9BACT|nr:alpha-amylase family glycosyl hydrolase [Silvibacterium bohemicum]MBB6145110.1 glycosidase [Silvibacterium bohemicum]
MESILFALVLSISSIAGAQSSTPVVDKIDPPNWWVNMPSPMLLLHGDHLNDAKVTVHGPGISIEKTQASANGHYLFVWLETRTGHAQKIALHVANPGGAIDLPFTLSPRKPASAGFQGFSSSDVMYLIMTDRFADGDTSNDPQPGERGKPRGWHGGDFRGIEQHLDYLQQLGVTTIWTTPAYSNAGASQAYHGYSATNMYAVDPHFGSLADYQHLAQAIHAHGMKIVLDTVPNHVGAANPWAKDPPTPDWFHGTVEHHDTAKTEFRSLPDPHASWSDQRDVTEGWFANVLPDLNQENPLVKQYLIQNAVWWVETAGLDGLRLDTFPYVGRAFWHDFHAELHTLYPHLTTVGEVFNPDPTITSFFAGGVEHAGIDTGLDTPFDFPTYFALRGVLTHDMPMSKLDDVLRQDRLFPHPERLVTFLGNHDTTRFLDEPGATVADLKLAFALLATLRGMPQIYSGDEIAMRGGEDPDNRHDFPGGFPGDSANAYQSTGRTPEEASIFEDVSRLMHFRAEHPALLTGQQQDLFADDSAFVFLRSADIHSGCSADGSARILVAINKANQPRELSIPTSMTALENCSQFKPELGAPSVSGSPANSVTLMLEPKQAAIYSVR